MEHEQAIVEIKRCSGTQFDPDIITEFDERFRFDHIFHDIQFFTGGVHAGKDEVATLPKEVKNRTMLMHYPETYRDQQKWARKEGFLGFAREGVVYTFD